MKPSVRRRRRRRSLLLLVVSPVVAGFIKPTSTQPQQPTIGPPPPRPAALTATAADGQGDDAPRYAALGVSAYKGEVLAAVGSLEQQLPSLYPSAFCKVVPDVLTGSPDHALIMHSDGESGVPVLTGGRVGLAGRLGPHAHTASRASSVPHACSLGAGTKTALAYLYWKETGDSGVWRGIAQDALAMNLDDVFCCGATGPSLVTSTIGRNRRLVPGYVGVVHVPASHRLPTGDPSAARH